jgi:glycogen debranching enzyme
MSASPSPMTSSGVRLSAESRVDSDALATVLCALGSVPRVAALGMHGPLVASAGASSLFNTLFGRDAIRMAFDLLDDFPTVAYATLLELARLQGVRVNPRADEEPGRILHEHRHPADPLAARLQEQWDLPYYGSVDSTPQWINLLAAYVERHGDDILGVSTVDRLGRRVTVRRNLERALSWITQRLDDPVGGGYLWVRRAAPSGILNQVWEDSTDSHYHEDGTLLDPLVPYAPVAVQGYAYDALLASADLLETPCTRGARRVAALRARAAALRSRVLTAFWLPDLGTFAQALVLDSAGPPRQVRVIASSPGHLLASRLLDGTDAAPIRAALIARLAQPDLLAGAGIRTKATGAVRFRAGSYHNGSTWPMDTGVIADGLRRHGEHARADDLESRIVHGCALVGGFPEFFRGEPEGRIAVNTAILDRLENGLLNRLEQPPQANQGWTATRLWRILRRRGELRADAF